MKIFVVKGKGVGRTKLSSFAAARQECGLGKYNLIKMTSIIPPGSTVEKKGSKIPLGKGEYGDRAYTIFSRVSSEEEGKVIGATLGWKQFQEDNSGVFVEHHLKSNALSEEVGKERLKNLVFRSLSDICSSRGEKIKKNEINWEKKVTRVVNKPTSVIVAAVFATKSFKK